MRALPVLALVLIALAGSAGCGGHRCETYSHDAPIYVDSCPTYTYRRTGADEAKLLADEKRIRDMSGVANVRTRLDGETAMLVVTVERGEDIEVREALLKMGYQRRW